MKKASLTTPNLASKAPSNFEAGDAIEARSIAPHVDWPDSNLQSVPLDGIQPPDKEAWMLLLASLALTVLEGALRKWVVPFNQAGFKYVAYFSKDVVFAALLFFPRKCEPSIALTTFRKWLFPGCIMLSFGSLLSGLQGFNPVGALLTFRATIFLPVVAFLAVSRLKNLSLRRVAGLLGLLTVLNFGLGIEQNRLPAGHVLNRYAAETEHIAVLESGVRATGTFSYITGMAVVSSIGVWAGLALLSLASTYWERMAGCMALVAGIGCGLASVSRAPVMIGALMVAVWILSPAGGFSVKLQIMLAGASLVGLMAFFELTPKLDQLGQGWLKRHDSVTDKFQDRAFGQLGEAVMAFQVAPLGMGFGTEQVGGNYYESGKASFTNFETQLPRLILETGVLGLVGFIAICAGAIVALQRAKHDAQSSGEKAMLLATQLLLLPMFYTNVVFNHTASAFAWMVFAAVLAAQGAVPNELDSGA